MDRKMDIKELTNNLKTFVENCSNDNYIYNELSFDEAYPDITPTSFIVNLVAKKSWEYPTIGQALDTLTDTLRVTIEPEIRRNIFTLSLYTIDEMVNSQKKRDWEQIATNPDLTPEQIKKLFNTQDKNVIALLVKQYLEDVDFQELILADAELKPKFLALTI
jgi:hypothetical protein